MGTEELIKIFRAHCCDPENMWENFCVDGVEMGIAELTSLQEVPNISTAIIDENNSVTVVKIEIEDVIHYYTIDCSSTLYYSVTIFTTDDECFYHGVEIPLDTLMGGYIRETCRIDFPSDFNVIRRIVRVANPIIRSVIGRDRLLSYLR
jgi:hypothetical protein